MDHIHETPATHEVEIDGVVHKTGTRHYRYPGKLPEDDIITSMEDGIREMIPEKVKELMERQDELLKWYREATESIDKKVRNKEIDETAEYFATSMIELNFMEYAVINKWLKYYLRLAGKVAPERPWITQNVLEQGITDEQLAQAKEHPIEDMYDGWLRVNGQRLIGRCPFHEEKTPSFVIFTDDNHFYCFGCHKHGDALDFYMWKNKIEYLGDAVKALI